MGLLNETNAQYYSGQQYIGRSSVLASKGWKIDNTEAPREQGNISYRFIDSWDFDTNPESAYGPYSYTNPIADYSNYTIYYQTIYTEEVPDRSSDGGNGKSDGSSQSTIDIETILGEWISLPENFSFVATNITNNTRSLGLRFSNGNRDVVEFLIRYYRDVLEQKINNLNISTQEKNTIKESIISSFKQGLYSGHFYIQLKQSAVDTNYGDYSSVCMDDIVNNFIVGYVGVGKLISSVKRTDVMFHAKRGLQEFSYDTLKSIRSQELTIPPSLSLPLPQDYVNYVKCSWIDDAGAKHIIYPTRVTSNPNQLPIQDEDGIPSQNFFGENNYAEQSITEDRWASQTDINNLSPDDYRYPRKEFLLGQRYGLQPEEAQVNGKFTINERLGTFSFSSDLVNKLIILEYISDGLSDCDNECIPKMAEQAMYMHIAHGILSSRMNVPEYIINRYKRERSSALRTAKIRLSNVKIEEISQVFRNKGKWIKH